jgi:cyclase
MSGLRAWLVGLAIVIAGAAFVVHRNVATFDSAHVAGDVWIVLGLDGPLMAAGNVAVLKTGAGPVVVDSMTFPMHGRWIQRFAARLGDGPVQAVINTHYHQDHTHGNPAFARGTRVIATDRTRRHLLARDAAYWQGDAEALLPNETFAHGHDMAIGGKTIRSKHLGRGHTDGDLVVLFEEDRVVVVGDLLFHRRYPNIDLEAGGSIPEWIATLDRVLELEFDHVIPGHGPVTDRDGIREFQSFLRELWAVGEESARAGRSLEDTLATARLTTDAGYGTIGIPFMFRLDRDFALRRAWEEATGAVEADGR